MARTVRDAKLQSREARAKLPISATPYYRYIEDGLHLGYRKGKSARKWVVRWYVGEQYTKGASGKAGTAYHVEALGTTDDIVKADGKTILDFSQAQALAREMYVKRRRTQVGLPADTGPYTVKKCLEEYIAWLEAEGKDAATARYRANTIIIPTLGKYECAKLTSERIVKWRNDSANSAPRLRTKSGEKQKFRDVPDEEDDEVARERTRRRRATLNRTLTVLKAALNHAWADHKITSDGEWRRVKPYKDVDKARAGYLTIAEAKRLINACDADFRKLVQAALLTGLRYGDLCGLNIESYNPDSRTLDIRSRKPGEVKHIYLNPEGAAFFDGLTAGREPGKPMLTRDDGTRWGRSHQKRRMEAAVKAAKINKHFTFHGTRHTYASHAVMNGAALIVVAKNLGQKDTRMVEKHYGHLTDDYVANAIREAAPKFGIRNDSKTVRIKKVG